MKEMIKISQFHSPRVRLHLFAATLQNDLLSLIDHFKGSSFTLCHILDKIRSLHGLDFCLTWCCCLHFPNRHISVRHISPCHRYLASHLCVYWWMHAQQVSVCVCARRRAHACTALAWEQCVMTPAERWCVKRCNVCVRRRCQHHGPLSWPGFLTQRYLSQLIGRDTNFLAEPQRGRSNLIAAAPLPYTRLQAAPLIIQPLVRVISTPDDRRLTSSFSITSDWSTQAHCPPALPKHNAVRFVHRTSR